MAVHYGCADLDPRRVSARLSFIKQQVYRAFQENPLDVWIAHLVFGFFEIRPDFYDLNACLFGLSRLASSDARIHHVVDLDDFRRKVVDSHNGHGNLATE